MPCCVQATGCCRWTNWCLKGGSAYECTLEAVRTRSCVARLGCCRMLGILVRVQGEHGVGIMAGPGVACMLRGGAGGGLVDSCGVWLLGEALNVLAVAVLAGACAV